PRELCLVGAGKHRRIPCSNAKREFRPWTGNVPRSGSSTTVCLKHATTPGVHCKRQVVSWKKHAENTKPRNVKSPVAITKFFFSRENCRKANKSRPRSALSKLRCPDKSKLQTNALPNWKTNWPENRRLCKRTKVSKGYCGPRRMISRSVKTRQWSS